MNTDWRNWITTNRERGCNRFDMLREMTSKKIPPEEAERALEIPRMPRAPHSFSVSNAMIRMYGIRHFLTPAQCEELCFVIEQKRRPSEVAAGGKKSDRTSTTCDMLLGKHDVVDEVDALICARMGFSSNESEIMQGQHYETGQHFLGHCDYFADPSTDSQHCTRGGRTWTFMVYLTAVDEGGETEFTKLGIQFRPEPGMALVWCNLDRAGRQNPLTEHRAHPIVRGTKIILTKWFREIPAAST